MLSVALWFFVLVCWCACERVLSYMKHATIIRVHFMLYIWVMLHNHLHASFCIVNVPHKYIAYKHRNLYKNNIVIIELKQSFQRVKLDDFYFTIARCWFFLSYFFLQFFLCFFFCLCLSFCFRPFFAFKRGSTQLHCPPHTYFDIVAGCLFHGMATNKTQTYSRIYVNTENNCT